MSTATYNATDQLAVNTIRTLSIDAVERANSGHPGMPMGAAPMAYVLWTRFLKHNPANPAWFNRDRFVLSAGHGSMLLYSLLHLSGYDVSLDDLKQFRQWGSKTPGHPEYGHTPGVEATTGPLGQGLSMAVGMAMAERFLAATYNRENYNLVDHYTYVLCGDGDLMEGITAEAASLAGHLKLGRLIVLYDSNAVSLDGDTRFSFTENVAKRYEAYGWETLRVEDGNDLEAIGRAIAKARESADRPTLIEIRTTIGYGSPNKGGKSASHGAPLGAEEVRLVKQNYNWPYEPFHVPDEVRGLFARIAEKGKQAEAEWNRLWNDYQKAYPALAEQFENALRGKLPQGWDADIPVYRPDMPKIATRTASEQILNAIGDRIPYLLGGSADLASANKTMLKNQAAFQADDYTGRNVWYGVREHAMAAAMNGMMLHGGVKAYGGTFLVFSDYMRPAIRLSALMKTPVVYVLTHDSIAYGEDGPTHQPIEQLPSLRLIPGLTVIRPADANETAEAYRYAFSQNEGPVAVVLSRHDIPILEGTAERASQLPKGAYTLYDFPGGSGDLVLIATGSEVALAAAVREALREKGISARVVSMPSRELFERQPQAYRDSVLPPSATRRIVIEMAQPAGWDKVLGPEGMAIGIEGRFGASAPGDRMMKEYGFTVEAITEKILSRYQFG